MENDVIEEKLKNIQEDLKEIKDIFHEYIVRNDTRVNKNVEKIATLSGKMKILIAALGASGVLGGGAAAARAAGLF